MRERERDCVSGVRAGRKRCEVPIVLQISVRGRQLVWSLVHQLFYHVTGVSRALGTRSLKTVFSNALTPNEKVSLLICRRIRNRAHW